MATARRPRSTDDPSVLFVSLQQDRLFPIDSGTPDEIGRGDGAGYTVNIALPAGSGGAAYSSAFERIIVPLAEQFKPQLVFVSAGQDASASDPLGRMQLASDHYRHLTGIMQGIAERTAEGRSCWPRRAATARSTRPIARWRFSRH